MQSVSGWPTRSTTVDGGAWRGRMRADAVSERGRTIQTCFTRRSSAAARRRAVVSIKAMAAHEVLELPETHALSWVHELVGDWHAVFDKTERLYGVARRRLESRIHGDSHGDTIKKHPSGWTLFDAVEFTRPSALDDAIRRICTGRTWRGPAVAPSEPGTPHRPSAASVSPRPTSRRLDCADWARRSLRARWPRRLRLLTPSCRRAFIPQSDASLWEATVCRWIDGGLLLCCPG